MSKKAIDLTGSEDRDLIKDLRTQIQKQPPKKLDKPSAILGDPSKRVQVGHFPDLPKDLIN
jgi:hypothetical protein